MLFPLYCPPCCFLCLQIFGLLDLAAALKRNEVLLVMSKSPSSVQLLRGLFDQLWAKARKAFLFIHPGFIVGALGMYYLSPFLRLFLLPQELAQILCGALQPDKRSFGRNVYLLTQTDVGGRVSQAR